MKVKKQWTFLLLLFSLFGCKQYVGLKTESRRSPEVFSEEEDNLRITESQDGCQVHGDLTLLTHYKEGIGFSPGGTDVGDFLNRQALDEINQGLNHVTFFKDFIPDSGDYLGDRFDTLTYPEDRVRGVLSKLCGEDIKSVYFNQPGLEIKRSNQLGRLIKIKNESFQVVHSIIYKDNLFTLVLPPFLIPSASYPLLINGFYSLNSSLIDGHGPMMFQTLSNLWEKDKIAAIGVLWNGGGSESSFSMNDKAYIEFNEFIELLSKTIRIDARKVVTFGGSRGGITALNLAAHPAVTAVNVAATYAAVPPSNVNLIGKIVGSGTVPQLLSISDSSVGYHGSWQRDYKLPNKSTTGLQRLKKVLTGYDNDNMIERFINLTAPVKMNKLKKNRTDIFLEMGSHDFIVPFADQLLLFRKLRDYGVRVEGRVNYFGGHLTLGDPESFITDALRRLAKTSLPESLNFVNKAKKSNYLAVQGQIAAQAWSLDYASTPLTIEFPKFIMSEYKALFILTGVAGKRYLIVGQDEGGAPHHALVTLPEEGVLLFEFQPEVLPLGTLTLKHVFEVDQQSNLSYVVEYMSNLKDNPPIRLHHVDADAVKGELIMGNYTASYFMKAIHGQNCERCYVPGASMSYGILETGRRMANEDEQKIFDTLIKAY